MDCGKIVAGRIEPKKYTAGSIQTLHRNLDRLTEYFKSLDLVVWDEAHHVPARTYRIVGRGLRLARGKKDCLLLDFTGISEKHEIVGLEHLQLLNILTCKNLAFRRFLYSFFFLFSFRRS